MDAEQELAIGAANLARFSMAAEPVGCTFMLLTGYALWIFASYCEVIRKKHPFLLEFFLPMFRILFTNLSSFWTLSFLKPTLQIHAICKFSSLVVTCSSSHLLYTASFASISLSCFLSCLVEFCYKLHSSSVEYLIHLLLLIIILIQRASHLLEWHPYKSLFTSSARSYCGTSFIASDKSSSCLHSYFLHPLIFFSKVSL